MVGLLDGHALHLFDAEEMRDADRLVQRHGHLRDRHDRHHPVDVRYNCAPLDCLEHDLSVLALGGEAIDSALWEHLRALSA